MDRKQLKQCLQAAAVPEDRYLLVGLDAPRTVGEGACILRPNQRSWEVLVWESMRMHPSLTFLSEDEACEYVLTVLTGATTASVVVEAAATPGASGSATGPAPATTVTAALLGNAAATARETSALFL
jgi:hypothetical protein